MFKKFNRDTEPLIEYQLQPNQKPFNLERKQAVTLKDSLIDPHQTILSCKDPLGKDPGYVELGKRNSVMHYLKSLIIKDSPGRIIIKID